LERGGKGREKGVARAVTYHYEIHLSEGRREGRVVHSSDCTSQPQESLVLAEEEKERHARRSSHSSNAIFRSRREKAPSASHNFFRSWREIEEKRPYAEGGGKRGKKQIGDELDNLIGLSRREAKNRSHSTGTSVWRYRTKERNPGTNLRINCSGKKREKKECVPVFLDLTAPASSLRCALRSGFKEGGANYLCRRDSSASCSGTTLQGREGGFCFQT